MLETILTFTPLTPSETNAVTKNIQLNSRRVGTYFFYVQVKNYFKVWKSRSSPGKYKLVYFNDGNVSLLLLVLCAYCQTIFST